MNQPNIGKNYLSITAVGSRVTCNPAPTNTDQDWLVLIDENKWTQFSEDMETYGFELGGSLEFDEKQFLSQEECFSSYTRGEDNIIATSSAAFHKRFLAASSVAKRLNLLDKQDRLALFQAVLYAAQYQTYEDVF
jgi:hypothetical protein